MSPKRPELCALAEQLGIWSSYRDVDGQDRRTSDETRQALLAAMGRDASDEAAAARERAELERRRRERPIEPVLVWREWQKGSPELRVDLHGQDSRGDYGLELQLESGERACSEGRLPEGAGGARVSLPLPLRPPPGYHDLELVLRRGGVETRARQRLVMAPRTVVQPHERIGPGRAFGLWANLYSVRGRGDFGHGGLRELVGLGRLAGASGAAFVGTNPLHAVLNRGFDFSPYSPVSRLYRNVLYLDPESVPELAQSPAARVRLEDPALRARRSALESGAQLDHQAVLELKLPLLRELHRSFGRAASAERRRAYADYRRGQGQSLVDFATWEVLAEQLAEPGAPPRVDWWRWPEPLRDPRSAAVADFRRQREDEVDFRCWLQFELDRQLAEAARSVREAGCALGIYQDLALGSNRGSADTWMNPGLYAVGAQVGAPPDAYAPEGQAWGFPPFDPHRLRDDGYRAWARLLRAAFDHAGALRIDHAMGLMRLFWIPEGRKGSEGAYVSYRADELLGVLALESRRQGALVVAEDLGTVPPELPGLLADWGLLRSAVVYFSRDDGRFRPSGSYPPNALATVGTHDLAPLAGYFQGSDLELRHRAGGFESEADLERARAERWAERAALVDTLRAESFLGPSEAPDDSRLQEALHRFLAATPSALVGVSLDDLAGEREPVNVPGVPLHAHRSWSRRMSRTLEELRGSPGVRALLELLRDRSLRSPQRG